MTPQSLTGQAAVDVLLMIVGLSFLLFLLATLVGVWLMMRPLRRHNDLPVLPSCPVTRAVRPPPRRTIGRGGSGGGSGWAR